MKFVSETTHLGLKRTISEESKININDRISLARRTLYSLIKTGVEYMSLTVSTVGHHAKYTKSMFCLDCCTV